MERHDRLEPQSKTREWREEDGTRSQDCERRGLSL